MRVRWMWGDTILVSLATEVCACFCSPLFFSAELSIIHLKISQNAKKRFPRTRVGGICERLLVIIGPIETMKMTILAKKIIKIGQLGLKLCLFWYTLEMVACSESWPIIFPANPTHLDGHVETSSHHRTNWHMRIDHISRKNHQDWSIVAEIMPILI